MYIINSARVSYPYSCTRLFFRRRNEKEWYDRWSIVEITPNGTNGWDLDSANSRREVVGKL